MQRSCQHPVLARTNTDPFCVSDESSGGPARAGSVAPTRPGPTLRQRTTDDSQPLRKQLSVVGAACAVVGAGRFKKAGAERRRRPSFSAKSSEPDSQLDNADIENTWNEKTVKKRNGITTQGERMLGYDSRTVLRGLGPWRTLFTMARHSTVFALAEPLKICASVLIFAVTFVSMSYAPALPGGAELYDLDELTDLLNFFNALLSFLLALYVSSSVKRWWDMRVTCIGELWDSTCRLSMWASAWWCSGSSQDSAARALVLRYGLAAHALLFKEARGELQQSKNDVDAGLADLLEHRLLRPAEARVLAPLPSKAAVVLSWLTGFWSRALAMQPQPPYSQDAASLSLANLFIKCLNELPAETTGGSPSRAATIAELVDTLRKEQTSEAHPSTVPKNEKKGLTPIPHAAHLMPLVMQECAKASDAVSHGLTHVSTQQPFAYTHLLALSVWVAVIINALLAGLTLAYTSDPEVMTGEWRWPTASSWPLYFSCIARLVVMPVMYDGLLGMGAQLENPFLSNHGFPHELFEHDIHAQCQAMARGMEPIESGKWWRAIGLDGHVERHGNTERSMGKPSLLSEDSFSFTETSMLPEDLWRFGPEIKKERRGPVVESRPKPPTLSRAFTRRLPTQKVGPEPRSGRRGSA